MAKIVFWNVDTQKDFINADGKLPVEGAEKIKTNLATLTNYAKDLGVRIVSTADCHNSDSAELSDKPDFIKTFPNHCMRGSKGVEFIEETYPGDHALVIDWEDEEVDTDMIAAADDIVLLKDAFNVFEGNKFTDKVLDKLDPDCIVVYGVATNVCVDAAVTELLKRKRNVVVVIDAIKELPGLPLEAVIKNWQKLGATFCVTTFNEKDFQSNPVKNIICVRNCSCDFPTIRDIMDAKSFKKAPKTPCDKTKFYK